ncbi:hypothetical protein NMEN3001_0589 [Neisseria meningitidis NM3001]|nr:hypothetical protein [Neisseria sp. HMSC070F02]EJU79502.1 hypothetical protein NMEN3001_0589 [Neisseria meningitidis NM3001]RPC98846.1 hypothetical protein JY76_10005 [Neisseria meningitidis]OFQ04712.1 hypothetical protein HMPREF2959_04765 [Neisseria sp. HMSC070F02]RPD11763.1 hypothetical protein JY80_01775 [Neisseria meningitidis]RPD12405.1 hypothetical protein JY82_05230 [Neisseria meningitidis]
MGLFKLGTRPSKENCEDLGFAIVCMFYDAINLSEFKLWLDIVVRDTPIDTIPLYIFDLIDFDKSIGEIYDVIGVVNYGYISNDQKNALTGIAFLRGIDVYDPPISKEKALKALEKYPEIYQRFQHFFPFVELPLF